jgi:hypothetical protein
MTAKIRNSHLVVNGVHYFRGNASAISLGDFGRKKSPVFGANYLEVYDNAGLIDVDLSVRLELGIDQDSLREAMGELTVALADQGASLSASHSKADNWNLSLVQLAMNLSQVEANVLDEEDEDDFARLGKKARVVYQVWVVVEAEHARIIHSATNLKATVQRGGVVVSGETGANRQSETLVTLSEGSTFAYLLARRKGNSHFTTDQHGPS